MGQKTTWSQLPAILNWLSHDKQVKFDVSAEISIIQSTTARKASKLFVGHPGNQVIKKWKKSTETEKRAKHHESEKDLSTENSTQEWDFHWQNKRQKKK